MKAADRQDPGALYQEALRRNTERLRLSVKICNPCPLKPLCYQDKNSWENIRQSDLLQIKNSCPIKACPGGKTNEADVDHEKSSG